MLLSRNQQLLSTDNVQSRQGLLLLLLYFAKCELTSKIFAESEVLGGFAGIQNGTPFGNKNREVPVLFLASPAAATLPGIDGIVGIAALQARRVHLDFSAKTLSWE
jgi:hypothetical protein